MARQRARMRRRYGGGGTGGGARLRAREIEDSARLYVARLRSSVVQRGRTRVPRSRFAVEASPLALRRTAPRPVRDTASDDVKRDDTCGSHAWASVRGPHPMSAPRPFGSLVARVLARRLDDERRAIRFFLELATID